MAVKAVKSMGFLHYVHNTFAEVISECKGLISKPICEKSNEEEVIIGLSPV